MKKLLLWSFLSFFIISCSEDATQISPESNNLEQFNKRKVTLLFNQESTFVSKLLEVTDEKLIFDIGILEDLEGKEYLVADQLKTAPNGFLRKIKSWDIVGDKIIVSTENADVTDLLAKGDIDFTYSYDNLPSETTLRSSKGDLVTYNKEQAGKQNLGTFTISLDRVIFDADGNTATTYDQIKAKGKFKFQPTLDFGVHFDWLKLKEFKTIVTTKKTMDVDLYWNYTVPVFEHSISVADIPLPAITIFVGWVPVVITNSINISIDAEGEVYAKVDTGVKGSVVARKGIHFYSNRWHYVNRLYDFNFEVKDLTARVGFETSLMLNGSFDSMFYGMLGVGIGSGAGMYAEGELSVNHQGARSLEWWAGYKAELKAYAKAGLFGIPGLKFSWEYPILSREYPIAEGEIEF